jgi:hypothetical protein
MSYAAQDEHHLDLILGMVDALHAELEELQSLWQEVLKLVARTEELEQFVDGLKQDGADPVVRRADHHYALGVMEAGWKEGDNQVREELATTQTLAQELKVRVDACSTRSPGGFCGGASAGRPPVAVDPGTLLGARAASTGGRKAVSR